MIEKEGFFSLKTNEKKEKEKNTNWTLVLPFFFLASITALLSRLSSMIDGFNLAASPSTCIGIVFVVTIFADLH